MVTLTKDSVEVLGSSVCSSDWPDVVVDSSSFFPVEVGEVGLTSDRVLVLGAIDEIVLAFSSS